MPETLAERIAEKHLPNKPFDYRGPNYLPVDLNYESRQACVKAIQDFAREVAGQIRAEMQQVHSPLDWRGMDAAIRIVEKAAGR